MKSETKILVSILVSGFLILFLSNLSFARIDKDSRIVRDIYTWERNVDAGGHSLTNAGSIEVSQITTSSGNLTLSPASGEVEWSPVWWEQRAHITQFYKPGINYPSEGEIGVTPVLLFDPDTDEWVYYEWEVPENYYTGSNIKIRFYWAPTDGNAGDVVWGIEYNIISSTESC